MDKKTGETYNLNSHGSAGLQGSVLPQPPDMVRGRHCVAGWRQGDRTMPQL